ncbi:MAG: hypothetical protein J3K34DRAFT_119898 [Monoraphidium minutum]|nr:MAG: hypothetical protein J3K34DRAFT_119898 [Monoraphidium minutum]
MSIPELDAKLIVRRCDDGSALPVLTTPGGKLYVISEADCEFEVVVTTGSRFPHPPRADMCYGADLKIDSESVGYWKTSLKPNQTIVFEGFCTHVSEFGTSQYQRFKFARADPSEDAGPEVTDPEQIKSGRIEVTIHSNVMTGTRQGPPSIGAPGAGAAQGHLPEGKKFFLAPSLKTGQGAADQRQVSWSTTTWSKVEVVASIELRYETASTLLLRKVLDKGNPAHRALLAGSRDPTTQALLGESDGEDDGGNRPGRRGGRGAGKVKRERGAAPRSGAGGAARVKPEPGSRGRVKPEPGLRGGGAGGGGGGFVDLTKPVEVPLRVGGRVVENDEIAVCDLLDSDDEGAGAAGGGAARWEVRKRQAVEVEGEGDI